MALPALDQIATVGSGLAVIDQCGESVRAYLCNVAPEALLTLAGMGGGCRRWSIASGQRHVGPWTLAVMPGAFDEVCLAAARRLGALTVLCMNVRSRIAPCSFH